MKKKILFHLIVIFDIKVYLLFNNLNSSWDANKTMVFVFFTATHTNIGTKGNVYNNSFHFYILSKMPKRSAGSLRIFKTNKRTLISVKAIETIE